MKIGANEIRFIDLENELSFEAAVLGKELYLKFLSNMGSAANSENVDVTNVTDSEISVKNIESIFDKLKTWNKVLDLKEFINILALISTKDNDYNFDNYDEMVTLWKKAPYKLMTECREDIKKFLSFFMQSIMDDLNILQETQKPTLPKRVGKVTK